MKNHQLSSLISSWFSVRQIARLRFASAAVVAFGLGQSAQGATTTYVLNSAATTWQTGSNWTPTGPASGAGNFASYNTNGTAVTTTLDQSGGGAITIGEIVNTGAWTITAGTATSGLILSSTGISTNNLFGNQTEAAIGTNYTGGLTIGASAAPINIAMATNLGIGAASTGAVVIYGNITNGTASTALNLNLRDNNNTTATTTINGNIGSTGSGGTIAINNVGTGSGTATINGLIGSAVTSITQNSSTSSLALSGASLNYSGTTNVSAGTLNFNPTGASATSMGLLSFNLAAGTVKSTFSAANDSVTFSNVTRSSGATGNFTTSGGTNGTTNSINLTQVGGVSTAAGTLLNPGLFYNGSAYATVQTNGGYVRGYTSSDVNAATAATGASTIVNGTSSNVFVTGAITAQTTASVNTINLAANSIQLSNSSQTLSTNGILATGTSAIGSTSGGSLKATTAGTDLVVQVTTGTLTLGTAIVDNSTTGLTVGGGGTVALTGANTYAGATTINAGTLQLGNGTTDGTISNSSNITDNAALNYNNVGSQSYSGSISGAGSVSKTSAGAQTLSGANSYSGATTISAGTLTIATGGVLGSGVGTAITTSGSGALNDTSTSANSITGASSINLTGTGSSVITSANNYSGTTTVGAGTTLTAYNPGSLGGNSGSQSLILAGGTINLFYNNGGTSNGSFTWGVGAGQQIKVNNSSSLNIDNASGTTSGNLVNFKSVNISNSDLTVANGTHGYSASFTSSGNIGFTGTSALTNNMANGTLTLVNFNETDTAQGAKTFTFNGTSASAVTSVGAITQGTGDTLSVTQSGAGKLSLTGVNTYTGSTTISAGNLTVAGGASTTASSAVAVNGGTLTVNGTVGGTVALASGATLSGSGGTLGALTVASGGIINTEDSGTGTLHGSTLSFASGTGTLDIDLGNGSANTDLLSLTGATLGGVFTVNANALSGATAGTTYTIVSSTGGGLTLADFQAGTLTGLGSDTITIGGGGNSITLTINAAVTTPAVAYFNGNTSRDMNTSSNYYSGPSSGTVSGSVGSTTDVFLTANSTTSGSSPANILNPTVNTALTVNSLTFTGTGTPATSPVTVSGTNTLTLAAASTGTYGDNTGVLVQTGAGNDTISAAVALGASQKWTVTDSTNTLTDSGGISGAGFGITKTGAGTLALTAASTYTGGTTVSAGTLVVANGTTGSATGTGTLGVGAGATLAGNGTSAGTSFNITGTSGSKANVLVGQAAGGDSSLGQVMTVTGSSGTSTIGNANLVFNLNATAAAGTGVADTTPGASNVMKVGSTLISFTTGVTLTLNLVNEPAIVAGNTPYVLIAGNVTAGSSTSQYSGLSLTGATTTTSGGDTIITSKITGLALSFANGTDTTYYGGPSYLFLYQDVTTGVDDIEVEVVPEPSTWAMMLGGLGVLVFWQGRKRRN